MMKINVMCGMCLYGRKDKEDSVIRIQTVLDVRGEAGLAEKDLRGISLHEILGRMERSYSFVMGL